MRHLGLAIPFAILATLLTLATWFIVPPYQVPDGQPHLFRATQIARGGLIAIRRGDQAGGMMPSNLLVEMGADSDPPGRFSRRAILRQLGRAAAVPWNDHAVLIDFSAMAMYGPVAYLPQAAGIGFGRGLGLSIQRSIYLARLLAALAFSVTVSAAVALCGNGRTFLAIACTLPMTLFLGGSLSQDGNMLALCALLAALLTRADLLRGWGGWRWAALGAGFGILGAAKLPLGLLSLLAPAVCPPGRLRLAMLCPLVAGVSTALWAAFGVAPVHVPLRQGPSSSETAQLHWLLSDITTIPRLVVDTLAESGAEFCTAMIGKLGWLSIDLPRRFVIFAEAMLCACWLAALVPLLICSPPSRREAWAAVRRILLGAGVLAASLVAVFIALDLTWTPTAAPRIGGIQGRYLLPMLIFSTCLLPQRAAAGRVGVLSRIASAAIFALWAFIDGGIYLATLLHWYW